MKKFKLLPTILMLVLCVGVLAVGVFAITPTKNTITGTIKINAASTPIVVKVYKDSKSGTKVAEETIRTLKDIPLGNLSFKTTTGGGIETANSVDDIVPLVYVLEFSTTSSKKFVIDTKTIEQYPGVSLTDETEVLQEDVVSVTKFHEPAATDKVAGKNGGKLAYFTNGKTYTITCTIRPADFPKQNCKVELNIGFDVVDSTEYEKTEIDGIDYIEFGEYPQTQVEESEVESVSAFSTDETFEIFNENIQTQVYQSTISELGCPKFVKLTNIYASEMYAASGVPALKSEQTSESAFFKFEPLKWRILKAEKGNTLIMCDTAIENVEYQKYTEMGEELAGGDHAWYAKDAEGNYILENGEKVNANNYKHSTLRKYLNIQFYNNAFGELQKSLIKLTNVDNSASTTQSSSNENVCENTNDYVFALSYQDLKNANYGFHTGVATQDADVARQVKNSDFSVATGSVTLTKEYMKDYSAFMAQALLKQPLEANDTTVKTVLGYILGSRAGQYDLQKVYDEMVGTSVWLTRSPSEGSQARCVAINLGSIESNQSVYNDAIVELDLNQGIINTKIDGSACVPALYIKL